jgi:Ca2+-binding RTX toxin-like protein
MDPGTTYIVDERVTVPTRPDADCFGPPGGSGAEFRFERPNVLSLLATAGRTTPALRRVALTDQFGFGLGICGIGGVQARLGETFWYFKVNHDEASVGADQLELRAGDEALFYLAPDAYPNPNPAELELIAPARARAGEPFAVSVVQHSCVTASEPPFATSCQKRPAAGVTVTGGDAVATTAADGGAAISIGSSRNAKLVATRGADIPSEAQQICVGALLDDCPPVRGKRVVGSPQADRIKGTAGSDSIRSRGGDDRIDARKGGFDRVNCGKGRDVVKLEQAGADRVRIRGSCERIERR